MTKSENDLKVIISTNIKDDFDRIIRSSLIDFVVDFDFEKGLDLLFGVVKYKCGIKELDGITLTIIPSLFDAYFYKRGELAPLKTLSTELEAFLKKIAYLISDKNIDFSKDHTKTLLFLINHLELHPTTLKSKFLNGNPEDFKKEEDYLLEFISRSYQVRNTVHYSPNWKFSEIYINLESVISIYLYSIIKYYKELFPIIFPTRYLKNPWTLGIEDLEYTEYENINDADVIERFIHPNGEYSSFTIQDPGFMDESHKYYIRLQYNFFLDPITDHERLIIKTEEIDPVSEIAIKTREIKDIEYRIYNNNIYEDLIEVDGPREELFATIIFIDEKCLKLRYPDGRVVNLIKETFLKCK